MFQKNINNTPKANESIPYGVGYKPFAVGVFINPMKEIKLTQGKFAQVDDSDFEWLSQWKWYAFNSRGIFYAMSSINNKNCFMHRLIMQTPKELQVDHIDHNGLNNQRINLRNCTKRQNLFNSRPSGVIPYLGVSYNKGNKIQVRISIDGKSIKLGSCKTIEQAAKRYDMAALYFRGKYANLNFKK